MRFMLFSALLLLAGCDTVLGIHKVNIRANPNNYGEIRAKTESSFDKYKNMTSVVAPVIHTKAGAFGSDYFLRSSQEGRNIDAPRLIQIYVMATFKEWAFLERAYADGERLDLVQIGRDVNACGRSSCMITETVGINFSMERLAIYASSGLDVKIEGNRGEIILSVPRTYFKAFLDEINNAPTS